MKGFRFFEELNDKNRVKETSQGNVIAVLLKPSGRGWAPIYIPGTGTVECLSAVFFHPDSAVNLGAVSRSYLRDNCRRISEEKARKIHTRLFLRLDWEEEK